MARKSKTKLFQDLAEIDPVMFGDAPERGLNHPKISNETFGKDSHIYVGRVADRRHIETELSKRGHTVDRDYWPGESVVDVAVTYFKGWHWDE
jgi:hypothetical protein